METKITISETVGLTGVPSPQSAATSSRGRSHRKKTTKDTGVLTSPSCSAFTALNCPLTVRRHPPYDNIECGFAKIKKWSNDPYTVQSWIHEAFKRRHENPPPDNFGAILLKTTRPPPPPCHAPELPICGSSCNGLAFSKAGTSIT